MYLKDGREIIESDKYPGYYIDQSNGAWCDGHGNYVGGNADDGDKPGSLDVTDYVYISKTGILYYPKPTAVATKRIRLDIAERAGYKPSRGYQAFVKEVHEKWKKKQDKKK